MDVQEAVGGRVSCHYDEALETAVKQRLAVVIASGEEDFDEALGKHGRLELDSLEGAGEQMGIEDTFWLNPSALPSSTGRDESDRARGPLDRPRHEHRFLPIGRHAKGRLVQAARGASPCATSASVARYRS